MLFKRLGPVPPALSGPVAAAAAEEGAAVAAADIDDEVEEDVEAGGGTLDDTEAEAEEGSRRGWSAPPLLLFPPPSNSGGSVRGKVTHAGANERASGRRDRPSGCGAPPTTIVGIDSREEEVEEAGVGSLLPPLPPDLRWECGATVAAADPVKAARAAVLLLLPSLSVTPPW